MRTRNKPSAKDTKKARKETNSNRRKAAPTPAATTADYNDGFFGVSTQRQKRDRGIRSRGGGHRRGHGGDANCEELGEGPNKKVYVRGLPWRAAEPEICDFFAACGTVHSVEQPLMDESMHGN
jgi:RNA recognition motif-containing protein